MESKTKTRVRRWLDALRSGRYKQASGSLRVPADHDIYDDGTDHFCCLGVMCDLAITDRELRGRWNVAHDGFVLDRGYASSTGMPPKEIAEAFGVSMTFAESLAADNDNGRTFEQIAERVESELLAE